MLSAAHHRNQIRSGWKEQGRLSNGLRKMIYADRIPEEHHSLRMPHRQLPCSDWYGQASCLYEEAGRMGLKPLMYIVSCSGGRPQWEAGHMSAHRDADTPWGLPDEIKSEAWSSTAEGPSLFRMRLGFHANFQH